MGRVSPGVVSAIPFCSVLLGLAPGHQSEAEFVHKAAVGEASAYTFSHDVAEFNSKITGDLTIKTTKLLDNDGAELAFTMPTLQATAGPDGTNTSEKAGDRTMNINKSGMAVGYKVTMGSTDFFYLLYTWASTTMAKTVKVGDSAPWKTEMSFDTGSATLEGTIKVTEITADRLKTQTSATLNVNGSKSGEFTNTSTFRLPDCVLLESVADFHVGTKQEIKFPRKPE